MNSIPLLKSKLMIPELPDGAILTERIKALPIPGKKATVIVAPGGFGKTTAVLLSLKKERKHTRWYRLEKEDSFLPVFYKHLIDTLFAGVDPTTLDCHKGLNGVSSITEEYALLNALICQDAWTHFSAKGPHCYLVLDDYQNVAENTHIAESIRYFIANMPPCLSIIVASRVEPGIYSGKLMLSKDVSHISEESLRFTREEAQKLLSGVYKIKATKQELDAIFDYTEGWVAGLYLLSRMENPHQISAARNPNAGASGEMLFNYFFNSFLKEIAPDKLEALAQMSIFEEFSHDELTQVLQLKNAGALLRWLELSNMYIQKIMTKPVKYRFHSLFRRELEIFLRRTRSQAEISELCLTAAQHYEKNNDVGNAIKLYLAAGDVRGAVNVIKTAGSRLFAKGQVEKIMYYINDFPQSVISSEPYLLFYKGCMLLTTNVEEAYYCFRTSLLMFRKKGDMAYLMNAFGMILVMSYQTNDFTYVNETVKCVPMLRIALSKSAPRKKLFITAFINVVASEHLKLGARLLKYIDRMSISEPIWEYSFLVIRGMLLYRLGRLEAARESFYRVMSHPVCQGSDQWRIIGLVGCHNSLWLSGDFEAARRVMDEFAWLGEKYDSDHCRSFAYRLSAFTKFRDNDIPGSIEDGQKNADMQKHYGSPLMVSAAMIARYVKECILHPSLSWAEKAEAEFLNISKENAGHGYYELSRARLGFIYKYAGELNRAEELLLEAHAENKRKGAGQHTAMLAMHLTDLYYLKNDGAKIGKYLREWVRLSEKHDYVFFYLVDHATLFRCCALAIQKGVLPDRAYKIARYYAGEKHAARLAKALETVIERPHEFAESCKKLKRDQDVSAVTLLGEFTITQNGVTIGENDWKTRKISGILKFILTERDKRVTRETLAATFWPDSDAKAASASLRVALSEIRKCFAAHGMSFDDERALFVEARNGFHINEKIKLQTDLEEFETLYKRVKRKNLGEEETQRALVRMLSLYKGDLLADLPYDDWASLRREHCRSLFIEASHALLRIYMNKGAYKEAEELLMRHMGIDPFDEKACGVFVKLLRILGQQDRANSFVRLFEKRFIEEMGIEPNIAG